jgi:hypothetical protein
MLNNLLGTPGISFLGLQRWYNRYKDRNTIAYKRDKRWFEAHPTCSRAIRPAMLDEFEYVAPTLDYFGKTISPPQLWVSVEVRECDAVHCVTAVYRGTAFFEYDGDSYALPRGEGNAWIDTLLFQMNTQNGVRLLEMWNYAEKVADVSQFDKPTGGVS